MATLTVYFKSAVIRIYQLQDDKIIHIGHDETNDLAIDSPDFAPAHAVVVTRGEECVIKQLNNDFPLLINGKIKKVANLHQGDTVTIGQHELVYSTDNEDNKTSTSPSLYNANYQIISGAQIGKIFPLKPPMTLIGEQGHGMVIVSKRKDGYFASILEKADIITLNTQALDGSTLKLNHKDVLVIGQIAVQFYLQ
jgi:pSer/pThr/pTyr-binding forkhead associated (FHA) protein